MKLVTEELITTLSQGFTIDHNRRAHVYGVRPYIVMYNAPAGTFTLSLKSGANTLASKDFTSAEIKSDLSTANDYAHLWKGLVFDDLVLLENGSYTLELSASGYTYSASSFIGWVREHENIFNDIDTDYGNDGQNPLSFQIFEYKKRIFHGR